LTVFRGKNGGRSGLDTEEARKRASERARKEGRKEGRKGGREGGREEGRKEGRKEGTWLIRYVEREDRERRVGDQVIELVGLASQPC